MAHSLPINYAHTAYRPPLSQSHANPWLQEPAQAPYTLDDADLPPVYHDTYEQLVQLHSPLTAEHLERLLSDQVHEDTVAQKIVSLIDKDTPLSYHSCCVALALLACHQHGYDISLASLDRLARDLPAPVFHVPGQDVADAPLCLTSPSRAPAAAQDASAPRPTAKSYEWFLHMDQIMVSLVPHREGRLFKHATYTVKSHLRQTSVIRRYSDFHLLWEALLRRYPLRAVPLLPPKQLRNTSDAFLENRRRGLVRFMNALVRHPCLHNDELVKKFIRHEDFASWWRQAKPTCEDEFVRTMPSIDSLRASIPRDLHDRVKRWQARLTPAVHAYDQLIQLVQRWIYREQANANDLVRFSVALCAMNEAERFWPMPQLSDDDDEDEDEELEQAPSPRQESQARTRRDQQHQQHQQSLSDTSQRLGALLDERCVPFMTKVLEQLQYQRDLCLAFQAMLVRRDQLYHAIKYQQHAIPKVTAAQIIINTNGFATDRPYQRLTKDQMDIMLQSNHIRGALQQHRRTFIHHCLAKEMDNLHRQQVFVSLLYQDLVRHQISLSKDQHQQWLALAKLLGP
ncbi:hypothetical protein BC940DRAFT_291557 [Gongronella butleri]|nr:hypothetical protein BC940DRAFT_291557 [Gongronella butleri]